MSQKDLAGNSYSSSNGKPAAGGTKIVIHTPQGNVSGSMRGGYAVPDKK